MLLRTWFAALTVASAAFLAAPVDAQSPGSKLPPVELDGLAQTGAETFDDFIGRGVLIEFFAYW